MAQRQQGVRARGTVQGQRAGGIRVLRSPAIAHMKELVNKGANSNYALRIRRR